MINTVAPNLASLILNGLCDLSTATVTAAINYYRHTVQFDDPAKVKERLDGLKVPVLSIFGTGDKHLSVASAKGSRKFIKVGVEWFLSFSDPIFYLVCSYQASVTPKHPLPGKIRNIAPP